MLFFLRTLLDVLRLNFLGSSEKEAIRDQIYAQAGYMSTRLSQTFTVSMFVLLTASLLLATLHIVKDYLATRSCRPRPTRCCRCWPSTKTFVALATLIYAFTFVELFLCSMLEIVSGEGSAVAHVILAVIFLPFLYL